ncbi:helix-turn-helix transcriptional regulator [Rhodococcus sp. 2H158]
MLEIRAEKVGREVVALAAAGADVTQVHGRAIELVGRTVRSDLTCWAMIDPRSLTIGSMTSGPDRVPPEYEPLLAESEYRGRDPGTFAELFRNGRSAARGSELPPDEVAHSLRHAGVWRPLGLDHELRVIFRIGGLCWGAAGFVRSGADFTDSEVEFLTRVAPAVASATRVAVCATAASGQGDPGPAVVLTGSAGEPLALTAAARDWQDRFDEIAPGRLAVMVRAAAFGARASGSGVFRTRIRDATGGWILMRATALLGGAEPQTVVTIEHATGLELAELLLAAYALTARERDVCLEVMAGYSTAEIADRRGITPNTVHDHLKAIYTKTGVRSRAELTARLRSDRDLRRTTAAAPE